MKKYICILFVFLASCSTQSDQKPMDVMSALKTNVVALKAPQSGDWLAEHQEEGQTVAQYKRCSPTRPSELVNVIYLQPIGVFDSVKMELINYTAEYLEICFGLKIKVLACLGNRVVADSNTRIGLEKNVQVYAPAILQVLKNRKPADAVVYMAITERDLYPRPDWNFAFGVASYKERIGATSMCRLLAFQHGKLDFERSLSRLIKVASHEIGHMFTLHHCTHAVCTMNGSNSLDESDRKPNRFCSECTEKLAWNLHLDVLGRLRHLQEYFKKHKLDKDLKLIEADLRVVGK
jgi:archaemetzincin